MQIRFPDEAKMICPHCRVAFKGEWEKVSLGRDADGLWEVRRTECAACDRFVVMLQHYVERKPSGTESRQTRDVPPTLKSERMVWPPAVARTPTPEKAPASIAKDYGAACRVLADSPEASAALSRRCLQNLLVARAGVKKKELADQIDEVLASKQLPARLSDELHAVRVIGNFAAHPIKSKITGEIVEVEPGEAEWNLDVLEGLFQHFYVDEESAKERRAAINAKLKDAGKPPLP
jgi:hypothetical protein